MAGKILVPIFGDQLTRTLASLRGRTKKDTVILMAEVWDETTHVKHHKAKLVLVLSAMRHFATQLREAGWAVDYVSLEDDDNSHSLTGELARAVERHDPREIDVTAPSEWRVNEMIQEWPDKFACEVTIRKDARFLVTIDEFLEWADGRDTFRMENFYREQRRKTGLLMDGDKPEGGQWNYDKDNRASPDTKMDPPPIPRFEPDGVTREVMELVERKFSSHFGTLENFGWPVTFDQADKALGAFIQERLPSFGTYQDAMVYGEDDLYHSQLSSSMNIGLLDPLECCKRAEEAYKQGKAPLNSVEGFIRQIIGWREYIRGMYWLQMPDLANANALNAQRALPDFYWTGETDMRCISDCVRSTRDNAHAHHIQRLMVMGNFALLASINPQQVEDWFLVVYLDAFEWVELPNTAAMALWADKGKLASKPYAASGNYINKMSDYCKECSYSVSKKTGDGSCPFNSLYWDFLDRNSDALKGNHRLARAYSTWERMSDEKRNAYRETAKNFMSTLTPADQSWARYTENS